MKASDFIVRPYYNLPPDRFAVYWQYEINHARVIFTGTKDYCNTMLRLITEVIPITQDKINSKLTEEKFHELENEEGLILQIKIGGLLFEFVSRDFHDGAGGEVNVECFILGKDTGFSYTGGFALLDEKEEKKGIPYDDEYCTHYYHKDTNHHFETTRQKLIDDIQKFIVTNEEHLKYATATDLTWDSIVERN